jgi:hypothetical protein
MAAKTGVRNGQAFGRKGVEMVEGDAGWTTPTEDRTLSGRIDDAESTH